MISTFQKVQKLPYDRKIALALLTFVLLSSLADMALIAAIYSLIGRVSDSGSLSSSPDFISSLLPTELVGISILALISKTIFTLISVRLRARFVFETQRNLANLLYKKVITKTFEKLQTLSSAELVRVVANESQNVIKMVVLPIVTVISEVLPALAIIFFAIFVEPAASGSAFLIVGLLGYSVFLYYRHRISEWGHARTLIEQRITSALIDSDRLIREIKFGHRSAAFLERFNNMLCDFESIGRKQQFAADVPKLILEGGIYFGMVSFLAYGFVLADDPFEVIGVIAIVGMTALRVIPAVYRGVSSVNVVRFGIPALDKIIKELDWDKAVPHEPEANKQVSKLLVNNLGYVRPESQSTVFSGISFMASAGQLVGIKGKSGAGKSTFLNVLTGLLKPSTGKISLNDEDITKSGLYRQVCVRAVPQQPYIFSGTIFENVSLFSEENEVTRARVIACLKAANIYNALGGGEEVVSQKLAENSKNISGGQSQRLVLARSLFDDPNLLILDEFTSALDKSIQASVISEIKKLSTDKIVIVVSHSDEVLNQCDFVIDLNK